MKTIVIHPTIRPDYSTGVRMLKVSCGGVSHLVATRDEADRMCLIAASITWAFQALRYPRK